MRERSGLKHSILKTTSPDDLASVQRLHAYFWLGQDPPMRMVSTHQKQPQGEGSHRFEHGISREFHDVGTDAPTWNCSISRSTGPAPQVDPDSSRTSKNRQPLRHHEPEVAGRHYDFLFSLYFITLVPVIPRACPFLRWRGHRASRII